jgi:hypothetical protein
MDTKHKMAITGSGLVAAGIGFGLVGTALMVPAIFERAAKLLEWGIGRFGSRLENASRSVGTVAGTLHRSFSEAARAGAVEMKRSSARARDIAS